MGDIIELEKDVHLVHGRIIKAERPGMFQGGKRGDLVTLSDGILVTEQGIGQYGLLTVFGFDIDDVYGFEYTLHIHHSPQELSEAAKVIVRKELPDYADSI